MKALIIAVLIIAVVIVLGTWLRSPATPRQDPFSQVPVAPGSGEAPEDERGAALLGEWKRCDGDFLLHVRSVRTNGRAAVGYFHPAPVHVAVAKVSWEDGVPRLYVELQDRGYAGASYHLGLAADGTLRGTYSQAEPRASREVAFLRVSPPASLTREPDIAPAVPPPGR